MLACGVVEDVHFEYQDGVGKGLLVLKQYFGLFNAGNGCSAAIVKGVGCLYDLDVVFRRCEMIGEAALPRSGLPLKDEQLPLGG